jgi:hypothetical protein
MNTPGFIPRGSAKASVQLYGEPHTWSLLASRKEIRVRFGPNEQSREGPDGRAVYFPHLAKNERDMGYPQLRLGKSFETCLP